MNFQNTEVESNKFFDTDSPIGRYQLCYPEKSPEQIEKAVDKYKRNLYRRYIDGDTFNMSTYTMQKLAIKNSLYSSYELDILIVHAIDSDFRDEVLEMYNVTQAIVDNSTIEDLHRMTKDFELIEEAYGKRVKLQPNELKDKTMYRNTKSFILDYSPR